MSNLKNLLPQILQNSSKKVIENVKNKEQQSLLKMNILKKLLAFSPDKVGAASERMAKFIYGSDFEQPSQIMGWERVRSIIGQDIALISTFTKELKKEGILIEEEKSLISASDWAFFKKNSLYATCIKQAESYAVYAYSGSLSEEAFKAFRKMRSRVSIKNYLGEQETGFVPSASSFEEIMATSLRENQERMEKEQAMIIETYNAISPILENYIENIVNPSPYSMILEVYKFMSILREKNIKSFNSLSHSSPVYIAVEKKIKTRFNEEGKKIREEKAMARLA
jgi:hypothetical protein